MKMVIRRDRDDLGWIIVAEGALYGNRNNNSVFKTMGDACIAAYHLDSHAEVFVDDREHVKLANGIVFPRGEYEPQPVTFKGVR